MLHTHRDIEAGRVCRTINTSREAPNRTRYIKHSVEAIENQQPHAHIGRTIQNKNKRG